jgi:hypothetical protein
VRREDEGIPAAARRRDHLIKSPGAVFTPERWAEWLIRRFGVVDAWIRGSSVLDPTCGNGQFLVSIIAAALESGIPRRKLPLERLFGIEKEKLLLDELRCRLTMKFGIEMPARNLIARDILAESPAPRTNILVGNPPWMNFSDLPDDYKRRIKPLFIKYGLVGDARSLLLGHARADLAALIIAKTIHSNLAVNGEAYFFVPLSLFLNEGAHSGFRQFNALDVRFSVGELIDLDGTGAFPGIATRYGAARFRRDVLQHYPIPCIRYESGRWRRSWAAPVREDHGALSILKTRKAFKSLKNLRLTLPSGAKPRQGVNTCGSNSVMIFTDVKRIRSGLVTARSKEFGSVTLPSRFLYPLLHTRVFDHPRRAPEEFVLLPYNESSGKPLDLPEITNYPELWEYLKHASPALRARRGALIGTWIRRGYWWASLGVGPYSFAPFKVAWMAYGKKSFRPTLFRSSLGKPWQGNQALHAYVPCRTKAEADSALKALSRPEVAAYLESFKMSGTRSWAQPGRIARICEYKDDGRI